MQKLVKKILGVTDFPYFLTLLLGLLIYIIQANFESYAKSPTLVYHFSSEIKNVSEHMTAQDLICTIENKSNSNVFNDVHIELTYPSYFTIPEDSIYTIIYDPKIIPISPANASFNGIENIDSLYNEYTINQIHPNTSYLLKASIRKHPSIKENPFVYVSCEQPLRLVSGFEGWIVRHLALCNLTLFSITLLLVIIYILKLYRKK